MQEVLIPVKLPSISLHFAYTINQLVEGVEMYIVPKSARKNCIFTLTVGRKCGNQSFIAAEAADSLANKQETVS